MTFGEKIRERRKELDMTQEELAKRMGCKNKSTVCEIERGYSENLTIGRIKKFADVLGLSLEYLICDIKKDDEKDPVLNKYKILTDEEKKVIEGMINILLEKRRR